MFLDVKPGSRLKYTWEWNADGHVTEITVDLSGEGDGSRVRITHAGFSDRADFDRHAAGWDSYIDGLIGFMAENRPDE